MDTFINGAIICMITNNRFKIFLVALGVFLVPSIDVNACTLSKTQKADLRQKMCKSGEYSSFSSSGTKCLERQFFRRAEDTAMQVMLAKKCGFLDESKKLEQLARTSLPYTNAFNTCLDVNFDSFQVFERGFKSGTSQAKAGGNCSLIIKQKLENRLPKLITMGQKSEEVAKKLLKRLRIAIPN